MVDAALTGWLIICLFPQSAMTERLCTYDDNDLDARGKPTPEYIKLYEEWGKGEIGTIVLVRCQ
jgi:2,4-dienoyl-CoA reductase-like NADH-dependent reductase (Old Yellow Enzyme family)